MSVKTMLAVMGNRLDAPKNVNNEIAATLTCKPMRYADVTNYVTDEENFCRYVDPKYFVSRKKIGYVMTEERGGFVRRISLEYDIAKTLTHNPKIRASMGNYIIDLLSYGHADKSEKTCLRTLTPNEFRKLQGFPSDWEQVVSDTQAYKQFGNAVTVDVIYHLAKSINDFCTKNLIRNDEE